MSLFATPKVPTHDDEGPGKDLLGGVLCVFRPREYDPATPTKYGMSATVRCELWVVEGEHTGHYGSWFAAGNLARQIGEALDVGAMAPGRIESGTSANGKTWYGVAWATEAADLEAAEAAVRATRAPAPAPAPAAKPTPTTLGAEVAEARASIRAKVDATRAAADEAPDWPF